MGNITVLSGGDFASGQGSFSVETRPFGCFVLPTAKNKAEGITANHLGAVEKITEESVKRMGGAVGLGLVGGAAFGPVGLLAGLLGGGKRTEVTFIATFKDGRKLLGSTDPKTYAEMVIRADPRPSDVVGLEWLSKAAK